MLCSALSTAHRQRPTNFRHVYSGKIELRLFLYIKKYYQRGLRAVCHNILRRDLLTIIRVVAEGAMPLDCGHSAQLVLFTILEFAKKKSSLMLLLLLTMLLIVRTKVIVVIIIIMKYYYMKIMIKIIIRYLIPVMEMENFLTKIQKVDLTDEIDYNWLPTG